MKKKKHELSNKNIKKKISFEYKLISIAHHVEDTDDNADTFLL